MEPVHGGRDDPPKRNGARGRRTPQWSPSTEDGTTYRQHAIRGAICGRNGARPRRTGRLRENRPGSAAAGAAMEPVHGGRDDTHPVATRLADVRAAMEPVHGGRDDNHSCALRSNCRKPQWSPSTEDGTTSRGRWLADVDRVAAMEPVHGGRDDRQEVRRLCRASGPQWSPSTEDGTTWAGRSTPIMPPQPQWSPSTEDGTTRVGAALLPRLRAAAMEPVHGGRDDELIVSSTPPPVTPPQWSPSTEDGTTQPPPAARRPGGCRNGARPRRTGRPAFLKTRTALAEMPQWSPSTEDGTTSAPWGVAHSGCSRNGARPRRTGRPAVRPLPNRSLSAAMEPVHGGRDDPTWNAAPIRNTKPQWSPSTEDGTTSIFTSTSLFGRGPQWSPSTEDGTTPSGGGPSPDHPQGAAMEPVHGGRDDPYSSGGCGAGRWRRNGARPRRTGRPLLPLGGLEPTLAAMEPVHGGRDDLPDDILRQTPAHAAMEPVHGGRDDCVWGVGVLIA